MMVRERYSRAAALLGASRLERFAKNRVLVVGVGGVGGWCAEALARSGVGSLTLVDDDVVAESNLNRQCPALVSTVGQVKVEAMKARVKAIDPDLEVTAIAARYPSVAIPSLDGFDYIVDAIDSVDAKAQLILSATASGVPIVSSLGAARRCDPTKVRVKRFDKVEGDALARALRHRFKKLGKFPAAKFNCVVSEEPPADIAELGSLMTVTATFGMCLAQEVINAS